MSCFLRTNSVNSSSSRTSLSQVLDIVNEEQLEYESTSSELHCNDWNIPKVPSKEIYKQKWSMNAFKTTTHVKTVEQVYSLGKEHETCQLLNLESIKKHRKKVIIFAYRISSGCS